MKRLLRLVLAYTLLLTTFLFPVAAQEANASKGMGTIDYTVRNENIPSFSKLFGLEDDLTYAQTLLQEFTVDTEYGKPLKAAAKPYPELKELWPPASPMLYPVFTRESAYTSAAVTRVFFLLNEKMEQLTPALYEGTGNHCYATGADGIFYLGYCTTQYGAGDTADSRLYSPSGKRTDLNPIITDPMYVDGTVDYVGNLCVVNKTILAKWNRDTHTIGKYIATSSTSIFFDEKGTAYGGLCDNHGNGTLFSCNQSGVQKNYSQKNQTDGKILFDVSENGCFGPAYLSTLKGESGLYPVQNDAGLYGFQDDNGNWVIKPQFQDALPFSGKFSIVTLSTTADGLSVNTLIDRSGVQLENVRGIVQLIPGYGYCVSYPEGLTPSSGQNSVKSEILNSDGKPWIRSARELYYFGGSVLRIQNPEQTFADTILDLKDATVYVGDDNVARCGNLLLKEQAIGTLDGRVLSYTSAKEQVPVWTRTSILTYHKFGISSSTTDFGLYYHDIYSRTGKKIASDVFQFLQVGNYTWIEKDSERGYIDQNGTWVYHESWDTGMTYFDVTKANWFYTPVKYLWDEGILGGLTWSKFGPNVNISRINLVTMLYRIEGSPAVQEPETIPFDDYSCEGYYASRAVLWGSQSNIVNGYGNRLFGSQHDITREQAVAILYRFAQFRGIHTETVPSLSVFHDAETVSDYAKLPLDWAVANGIIAGKPQQIIDPQGTITRAEMATMVYRFCEKYIPS